MDRIKAGYVFGIVSIAVNLTLFALKLWVGLITGSLALMADAWNMLSDSVGAVVIIIAAKLSSRKADEEHPFGHGRWEYIAAIFVAFFIGIIAYDFLKNAIIQLINGESVEYGGSAVVVTLISLVVKEGLAQYAFYIARKTGNTSVKADGWNHRCDALSSVIILVGIFFARYFWWTDSVLGIIISLLIFYAAFTVLRDTVTKLLGETPNQELIDKITHSIKKVYHNDLDVHHIHIHNYVAHKELTLHIRLDKNMSIEQGHIIASDIENTIKEELDIIATIHIEPAPRTAGGS